MLLRAGARLGPYEIVVSLGAGGMGEVYRARDTRLDRAVAIKILPAHMSVPEARQRFEREARAVSALNHPHICTLHDIGRDSGVDYMVMELVDGETMADRLKKGPLPLHQALMYGVQIASALDRAHRSGVVHRDLKPGNIMLGREGVKVLDFGLAKVGRGQGAAVASGGSLVETLTTPLTGEGKIVGTLQYMAPEQLEGKEADARTDIFALGAVLYEMVTGKRAFEAKSHAGLISAIMTSAPAPVSSVVPVAPAALDRLIGGCLEKDPEERWQSAHDVAGQLRGMESIVRDGNKATPSAARQRAWRPLQLLSATALVTLSLAIGAGLKLRNAPAAPGRALLTFAPPDGEILVRGQAAPQLAFSPDGRHIAFAAADREGIQHLWIRSMDSFSAQKLEKTDGAGLPFWSPDSKSIGFFAEGKLKRIDLSGANLQTICDGEGEGGTWNEHGEILFSRVGAGLHLVPATAGNPVAVTNLDQARNETAHTWPQWLPDGRSFLYLGRGFDAEKSAIFLQTLGSNERTPILNTPSRSLYAPAGFLLFVRDENLLAQRLDIGARMLVGEPQLIAEDVANNMANGRAAFTISETGNLAYRPGGNVAGFRRLVWYDRSGKEIGVALKSGPYRRATLSPDDKRLAIVQDDGARGDLWALDLSSGVHSRLTFGPEDVNAARWSADSNRIVFSVYSGGQQEFRELSIGALGSKRIYGDALPKRLDDWTRDGRFLVYEAREDSVRSLTILPFQEPKPIPFLRSSFSKSTSRVSPDGRWIAYGSNESGRFEVYVASFPSFTQIKQISRDGGIAPEWSKGGRELFYVANNLDLMVVDVTLGATVVAGTPERLFRTKIIPVNLLASQYAVTSDGQRILVREAISSFGPEVVHVVLNWPAALGR